MRPPIILLALSASPTLAILRAGYCRYVTWDLKHCLGEEQPAFADCFAPKLIDTFGQRDEWYHCQCRSGHINNGLKCADDAEFSMNDVPSAHHIECMYRDASDHCIAPDIAATECKDPQVVRVRGHVIRHFNFNYFQCANNITQYMLEFHNTSPPGKQSKHRIEDGKTSSLKSPNDINNYLSERLPPSGRHVTVEPACRVRDAVGRCVGPSVPSNCENPRKGKWGDHFATMCSNNMTATNDAAETMTKPIVAVQLEEQASGDSHQVGRYCRGRGQ